MTRKIISVLFIVILLTLTGCDNSITPPEYSQAELLTQFHRRDMGTISKDEPFEYKLFLYNNHIDKDITIIQAKTSCLCLVGTVKEKTIRHVPSKLDIAMVTNERRFLTFKYNPKLDPDKNTGKFSQTIILQTDYKDNEFVEVSIDGKFK